jgi:CRP/FNR family transcriptional regulator, cyclic AMP receptor protein
MDRDEGMSVLSQRGWLSGTPVEFQRAILSHCRWRHLEAGAQVQLGTEESGDLIGLASGTIQITTIFGVADTPMMHLIYPVSWLGYGPIIFRQARTIPATAKSPVWLASMPQFAIMGLLTEQPQWWQHFLPLAAVYGDTVFNIAADLLIRGSQRRCAAVLSRLGGRRFAGRRDAAQVEVLVTQDELAAAANLSRNTTGAVLRKMAARGLIELAYRSIIVRSPTALRALVDAP